MSLKAYALTTVQRAADFIGLGTLTQGSDKYNLLERQINAVTEFIENYIGLRVKETAYTEEYDSEHGDTLVLNRRPVSGVTLQSRDTSLNEANWSTVNPKYYFIDEDAGIIHGASGHQFSRTRGGYRVIYTAGYSFDNTNTFLSDTEAGDLEMAAWLLIATLWNRGKGGAGIQSEAIGDYKVVYAKSMFENEDIQSILDKYADVGLGGTLTPAHY